MNWTLEYKVMYQKKDIDKNYHVLLTLAIDVTKCDWMLNDPASTTCICKSRCKNWLNWVEKYWLEVTAPYQMQSLFVSHLNTILRSGDYVIDAVSMGGGIFWSYLSQALYGFMKNTSSVSAAVMFLYASAAWNDYDNGYCLHALLLIRLPLVGTVRRLAAHSTYYRASPNSAI